MRLEGKHAVVTGAGTGIGGENKPGAGDRWDDIVATNLSGTYWCCRAAEPQLPDGGRIIVTSSILARIGVAGYTAYCASNWPGKTADEAWAIAVKEVPLRRMSEPYEIAATVAWLASPDSLGVTGQAIDHNNGAFMS